MSDSENEFDYSKKIEKYFNKTEWNKMPNMIRHRYCQMYEMYLYMTQSGIKFPKPDFMDSKKNNKNSSADEELSGSDFENEISNDSTTLTGSCFRSQNFVNKNDKKDVMIGEPSAKKRKTIDEKSNKSYPVKTYPSRNIAKKNYTELSCQRMINFFSYGDYVKNEKVPKNVNDATRAEKTVPKNLLVVKKSKISGLGVWNLKFIKKGTIFGPYEGEIRDESNDYGYSWEIKGRGADYKYIDAINPGLSNWLRYVNCARSKYEQNLISFQYSGAIYYKTITDIEPYNELLVWYGTEFATELGIDINKYDEPFEDPEDIFSCINCKMNFSNPIQMEEHEENCDTSINYSNQFKIKEQEWNDFEKKNMLNMLNELNINDKNIEEKSYKEEH